LRPKKQTGTVCGQQKLSRGKKKRSRDFGKPFKGGKVERERWGHRAKKWKSFSQPILMPEINVIRCLEKKKRVERGPEKRT